ncbi:hypothetical protein ACLB2K_072967 [Fragaria x ananassa]
MASENMGGRPRSQNQMQKRAEEVGVALLAAVRSGSVRSGRVRRWWVVAVCGWSPSSPSVGAQRRNTVAQRRRKFQVHSLPGWVLAAGLVHSLPGGCPKKKYSNPEKKEKKEQRKKRRKKEQKEREERAEKKEKKERKKKEKKENYGSHFSL